MKRGHIVLRIALLLLITFLMMFTSCSNNFKTVNLLPGITDLHQDQYRPYYELANCRALKNNPIVVLIFIDDNESHWTKEEVLEFTQEHIINSHDIQRRKAKPGEYIQGQFVNGEITIGKHFDANGKLIQALNFGVAPSDEDK